VSASPVVLTSFLAEGLRPADPLEGNKALATTAAVTAVLPTNRVWPTLEHVLEQGGPVQVAASLHIDALRVISRVGEPCCDFALKFGEQALRDVGEQMRIHAPGVGLVDGSAGVLMDVDDMERQAVAPEPPAHPVPAKSPMWLHSDRVDREPSEG